MDYEAMARQRTTTLAAEVAAGNAKVEDVDDWIDRWHDDPEERRYIHEMFGIPKEAYFEWLKQPRRLAELLAGAASEGITS